MAKIRILPDTVANKIAAGEVVERPASVVKELLENALDAGSTRVNIEVEAGGKRLIRVVDDGEGMARDDALMAFERHATSKLRTAEDLDSITTLGFRGEALPSIASVTRLFLRTRVESESAGTEVEFNGGRLVAVRDIAWPSGTELEVRDLFFNIPARRKFLKSDTTESFHVTNLVQHYALANPAIGFLLINNGREAIRVEGVGSNRDRAYQILGAGMLGKLVEVGDEAGDLKLTGFVSNPQEQRSSRDSQYLFINGRFVRDQLIGRALTEAYRSMMPSGTYPAAVLFIEVPPSEVDVNVHPAKTEVKFLREGEMLGFIRDSVARALRSTSPITRVPVRPRERHERDTFVEPASEAPARRDGIGFSLAAPSVDATPRQTPLDLTFGGRDTPAGLRSAGDAESGDASGRSDIAPPELPMQQEIPVEPHVEPEALPGLGGVVTPLGQIRDSYIVATDDEGLLLVDQHVAHERVLFEQFRDGSLLREAGLQPLLIPETLDLTPAEAEAFKTVHSELESMGIETAQLSGRTIAIKTAPHGLSTADTTAIVREVVAAAEREKRGFTLDRVRDAIAASMACKAAIKVNMPLTAEKMQWLIEELMKTANPMTCPHGRPIIMRMPLRDIERGFNRPV